MIYENLEFGEQIAQHLPGYTACESTVNRWSVTLRSGKKSLLLNLSEKRRIKVSGSYPSDQRRTLHKPKDTPEIGIGKSKTPQMIAQDIQRRLLPQYHQSFDEMTKNVEAYNKKYQEQERIIRELCKIIDENPEDQRGNVKETNVCYHHNCREIQVSLDGKVKITTYHLKPLTAKKILEVLRDNEAK